MKTKTVHIVTDDIGTTFQLLYDGKPCAGMSDFWSVDAAGGGDDHD